MNEIPAEVGARILGLAADYAETLAQLDPGQQELARTIFERVVNNALRGVASGRGTTLRAVK